MNAVHAIILAGMGLAVWVLLTLLAGERQRRLDVLRAEMAAESAEQPNGGKAARGGAAPQSAASAH